MQATQSAGPVAQARQHATTRPAHWEAHEAQLCRRTILDRRSEQEIIIGDLTSSWRTARSALFTSAGEISRVGVVVLSLTEAAASNKVV